MSKQIKCVSHQILFLFLLFLLLYIDSFPPFLYEFNLWTIIIIQMNEEKKNLY